MGTTYTNLLFHIVFSTKHRKNIITPEIQERLYEHIDWQTAVAAPQLFALYLAFHGACAPCFMPSLLRSYCNVPFGALG